MSFDSRNIPRITPFLDKDIPELFLKNKFVPQSKQLRRGYKSQSVNTVRRNNRLFLCDPHKTDKCVLWE
jgi:hypothetical protein